MPERSRQVIVVGAGGAGLYTALRAAREGARVTLVSATPLRESSSYWAQGGLAAAIAGADSPEHHLADTVSAGRGATRGSAARVLCEEGPAVVEDLAGLGIRFDTTADGSLALGLEGGHSFRRVVHSGGAATGRTIVDRLARVAAADEAIDIVEGRHAEALLVADGRCQGIVLRGGEVLSAPATVLATGGAAALWARTTNPPGATGSGLLLAYQAGAKLADLELVQFHPTALVGRDGTDGMLVSEAIRGEGAPLLDPGGERFVDELAPRDTVARAIEAVLQRTRARAVDLDMRDVDASLFPTVFAALRSAGIDPAREPVPVAPAAHYVMGGVATDLHGRATLPGLLAVGECSCTGLHGANRLASNSLTECFVFGARAAQAALSEPSVARVSTPGTGTDTRTAASPLSQASRVALWREAGLLRSAEGLTRLLEDPHPLIRLIGTAALARAESRGSHQRIDHPEADPRLDCHHITIRRGSDPEAEVWL